MQRVLRFLQPLAVPLALVAATLLFQLLWLALHWGLPAEAIWYADLSYLAVICSSLFLSLQTFLRAPKEHRATAGFLAGALLALSLGESLWVYFDLFTNVSPDASIADLCYYVFYALSGVALLRQANWSLRSGKAAGALLDSVIIVGVVGLYAWRVFLAQIVLDSSQPLLTRLVSLSYPLLDLSLLVLILIVLGGKRMTSFLALYLTGVALYIGADLNYAFLNSRQAYTAGTWLDALWTVGTVALALGGALPLAPSLQRSQGQWDLPAFFQRGLVVLPYLAGLASAALLILCVQRPSLATPGVVWGTVLLFGIVMLRQALALRENTLLTQALMASTEHLEQSRILLTHQAFHDVLTGLPNRALLQDRLKQALTGRLSQHLSVLCIDLDGFKSVNDRLGHAAGDALLIEASRRMKETLREGDTLARMGGDEFTVILCSLDEPQNAELVAGRLLRSLERPFEVEGEQVSVTASVGISMADWNERDAELLQRRADLALYQAKAAGKNCVRTFTDALADFSRAQDRVRHELGDALERGEFELQFQPQFRDRQVVGIEALLRWHSATLGPVAPDQFIPIAEDTGLIIPIGHWVLDQACKQAAVWNAQGTPLRVAVNISPLQFAQPEFLAQVTACLARYQLPGRLLELELTERLVVQDLQRATTTIRAFQQLGVSVALDDFGSGQSSLSQLMTLPISSVKIDRQFVLNAEQNPNGHGVIQAITTLARAMNLQVVAEGVETEAQWTMVSSLGCDVVQGYLLGRPMPAEQLNLWLSERLKRDGAALL